MSLACAHGAARTAGCRAAQRRALPTQRETLVRSAWARHLLRSAMLVLTAHLGPSPRSRCTAQRSRHSGARLGGLVRRQAQMYSHCTTRSAAHASLLPCPLSSARTHALRVWAAGGRNVQVSAAQPQQPFSSLPWTGQRFRSLPWSDHEVGDFARMICSLFAHILCLAQARRCWVSDAVSSHARKGRSHAETSGRRPENAARSLPRQSDEQVNLAAWQRRQDSNTPKGTQDGAAGLPFPRLFAGSLCRTCPFRISPLALALPHLFAHRPATPGQPGREQMY